MDGLAVYKILFTGKVQGVNFRKFCSKLANSFGLIGYVKNLQDPNKVEVLVKGSLEKIFELVYLLVIGNGFIVVESVFFENATSQDIEKIKDLKKFEIFF